MSILNISNATDESDTNADEQKSSASTVSTIQNEKKMKTSIVEFIYDGNDLRQGVTNEPFTIIFHYDYVRICNGTKLGGGDNNGRQEQAQFWTRTERQKYKWKCQKQPNQLLKRTM